MDAILRLHWTAPLTGPTFLHRKQPVLKLRGEPLKNIFIGNLAFEANEESVRSLFQTYGTIERVHLITERETGSPRGFAFVEMTDSVEADRAIEALNGTEMGGR